jgi:ATP-dependent DNA helicase RecG
MTTQFPPSPPPPPVNQESEILEYKRDASVEAIAPSVVAMLNNRGGAIYIGYSDDGELQGVGENAPVLAQKLTEALSQAIRPQEVVQVLPREQNGRSGLVIEVPPGISQPYVYDGRIYVRVGAANRLATAAMMSRMIEKREEAEERWERRTAIGVEAETLDAAEIRKTLTHERGDGVHLSDEETSPFALLERMDLAQAGWPTQAAVVLFRSERLPRYPQVGARAVVFTDETMTEIADERTFETGALSLVDRLFLFITSHLPHASILPADGLQRTEVSVYPIPAIREALVNALMHRDYEDQAQIQVRLFPHRLEVWNPGTLAAEYLQVQAAGSVSRPRNPDIARIFHLRRYAELWGIGLWRIRQEMAEANLPPPEWRNEVGGVRLTLSTHAQGGRNAVTETAKELLPRQAAFLSALAPGEAITREDYQSRFAKDISERSARNDLNTLREQGYLHKTGQGYYRAYVRTDKPWTKENNHA